MLDQSIDDDQVYYLNITPLPGYSNRFVKAHVRIAAGTAFTVTGFKRPHNLLCYWYDWEVILKPQEPLEASNAEVHMNIDRVRDPALMVRR